jgi:hypothetical protein
MFNEYDAPESARAGVASRRSIDVRATSALVVSSADVRSTLTLRAVSDLADV